MNRLKLCFAVRIAALGLPYAVLMIFGLLWLREHQLTLWFVAAASILSIAQWLVLRWMWSRPVAHRPAAPPSKLWPPAGERAWAEVDRLAARAEANPPPLNDANLWLRLFKQVFDIVATQFHPKSKQPAFEVPVIQVIKIAELVGRDLRQHLNEQVPAADQITIRHVYHVINWGPAVTRLAERAWNVIRIGRLAWNPAGAIAAEAGALAGGGLGDMAADLPAVAAGYCVRQAGRYAIDLYSGQLDLDEARISAVNDARPLRILVLGQAKAGKSSLINALVGTVRAATDVLPCTDAVTPFVLERNGLFQAILYDTIGFGGTDDKPAQAKLNKELGACDLVIAVSSAATAARELDRKLLDEARLRLSENTRQAVPPIIVALSHIDRVRPISEWDPPYDFERGETAKERNIRDAVQAVAEDLQVAPDRIVPVCLRDGEVYNVDEGLLPALVRVMPEAQKAKLLRVLMEDRTAAQREALKRLLIEGGLAAAKFLSKNV